MTIESVNATEGNAGRRLRLGMVGGGEGAFIGAVHRIASRIDDQYELVAAALPDACGVKVSVNGTLERWRSACPSDSCCSRRACRRDGQPALCRASASLPSFARRRR